MSTKYSEIDTKNKAKGVTPLALPERNHGKILQNSANPGGASSVPDTTATALELAKKGVDQGQSRNRRGPTP